MQIGMYLLNVWPTLLSVVLYLIGLISAHEGQRLNIAGLGYFVYGFALLILSSIISLSISYFIVVLHAVYGPLIAIGSFAKFVAGALGLIFIIIGVRTIVSAYKEYLSAAQHPS